MQNKTAEKEFFDRFEQGGGYDRFDERGYRRFLDVFEDGIAPRSDEILVDLGCGSGAFTYRLHKAFPQLKVQGIDLSEGCIARAKSEFKDVEFSVGDAESTGIADGTVDIVCYSGILHHFADFRETAREAYRILKPGGRFFSFDPHGHNPAFWLYRSSRSPFFSSVGITENERLLTAYEIREVFSGAGFEVRTRVISGVTFQSLESRAASLLLPLYNLLDRMLGATPLAGLIGAWVIGCGRKCSVEN